MHVFILFFITDGSTVWTELSLGPLLSLAKDIKLNKYTVPIGNRTPDHRVAVHNATASPRKLHVHSHRTLRSPMHGSRQGALGSLFYLLVDKSPTSRPIRDFKMHFKRLGSRVFHDLVNHYLCFFSKHNEYCKTEAFISMDFSRFSSNVFLMIFMNIKYQWDIIEKKNVGQL